MRARSTWRTSTPNIFKGLIIESGFAHALDLIERLGLPVRMLPGISDPIGNDQKIKAVQTPLLVIHGELDNLIPISEGEALTGINGPLETYCADTKRRT